MTDTTQENMRKNTHEDLNTDAIKNDDLSSCPAHDAYHALMLGYASGILDEAQNLIVSAHIALSPAARKIVRHYECLGASFLEKDCTPASLCEAALENVLRQLDEAEHDDIQKPKASAEDNNTSCHTPDFPYSACLSELLDYALGHCTSCTPRWKKIYPGFQCLNLSLDCRASHARFMKVAPAGKSPRHTHRGMEITLVLEGSFKDESGHYARGDLVIADENHSHSPQACSKEGCVCLVVSSAPIRLSSPLARWLNPFIRF